MNTVIGKYVITGNPCTTIPCLPGMVYAVLTDDEYYYLTVGGSWLWALGNLHSWDGYTPKTGEDVTVTGHINEKRDVKGNIYYEIEVVSLKQARKGE